MRKMGKISRERIEARVHLLLFFLKKEVYITVDRGSRHYLIITVTNNISMEREGVRISLKKTKKRLIFENPPSTMGVVLENPVNFKILI